MYLIKKMSSVPFFALSMLVFGNAMAAPTECADKIDPGLMVKIKSRYLGYEVPALSRLEKDIVDYNISTGGDGCYAVTQGNYQGNGSRDYSILLVGENDSDIRLIAALRTQKSWALYELPVFCNTISYCYTETKAPGRYERSKAVEDLPKKPYERIRLFSKHESIQSGHFESTGIVYVYTNKRWRYVWYED